MLISLRRRPSFRLAPRRILSCDGCNLARIQGIVCHETGCYLAWQDPETGEAFPAPCWQCGFDYVPDGPVGRYAVCSDCENPPADDDDDE